MKIQGAGAYCAIAALLLSGCAAVPSGAPLPPGVEIITRLPQPDAEVKHGSGRQPVNPAQYAVDPASYPTYRVTESRVPPKLEMFFEGKLVKYPAPYGSIEPGDTWRVRYRFRDYLVINSREFDARQCNFRASPCLRDGRPFWCIYISKDGEVTGGWGNCPCVTCDTYRFAPDPDVVRLQKWEPQPYFIPDR